MPKGTAMNVGAAITQLLKDNGLEPKDLRHATGWTGSYISQIMSGVQKDITLSRALKLADFFGITIDEFVDYALKFED